MPAGRPVGTRWAPREHPLGVPWGPARRPVGARFLTFWARTENTPLSVDDIYDPVTSLVKKTFSFERSIDEHHLRLIMLR